MSEETKGVLKELVTGALILAGVVGLILYLAFSLDRL